MKNTFPEIKLMVTLIKSELPNISTKEIQEKIWNKFKKVVSLEDIYLVLDIKFDEDFELEERKHLIKY